MPDGFDQERPYPSELNEAAEERPPRSRSASLLALIAGFTILGVLIYYGIAQGMAALVMFPGIPLVLLWFVYWFFLRRLIRIRNIRKAEEGRLLREAAQRKRGA